MEVSSLFSRRELILSFFFFFDAGQDAGGSLDRLIPNTIYNIPFSCAAFARKSFPPETAVSITAARFKNSNPLGFIHITFWPALLSLIIT